MRFMVSWISLVVLAVDQLSVYVCTGAAAAASDSLQLSSMVIQSCCSVHTKLLTDAALVTIRSTTYDCIELPQLPGNLVHFGLKI